MKKTLIIIFSFFSLTKKKKEFLPFTLADKLYQKDFSLSTGEKETLLLAIASGMRHLHQSQKIIHRDLACRNILLTEEYLPKIADFGVKSSFHLFKK